MFKEIKFISIKKFEEKVRKDFIRLKRLDLFIIGLGMNIRFNF